MATHSSTLALKIPWTEELGAGYYPQGRKESGTTELLHFHFLYPSTAMSLFSHLVMSNSLWPHGLQHARLTCLSLSPGACSNLCPLSHDSIQPSQPLWSLSPPPSIFPSITVFSNELALHIRWPKYWSFSFSISPSNEYSEVISFRTERFDLAV